MMLLFINDVVPTNNLCKIEKRYLRQKSLEMAI